MSIHLIIYDSGNGTDWNGVISGQSLFLTITFPSFQTYSPKQTWQTQIRLLHLIRIGNIFHPEQKVQSDQGLHSLPFCLHSLEAFFFRYN